MPDVHSLSPLNYSDKGLWHTSGLDTYLQIQLRKK